MNGTLWIAVAIVLPLAAFIVFAMRQAARQKKKKEQEMQQLLEQTAGSMGLAFPHLEQLPHKILALDAGQRVFVYVQHYGTPLLTVIHLDEVADCRLKYAGTTLREAKRNGVQVSEEHISDVYLSFSRHDQTVTDISVYSEIHDGLTEKLPLIGIGECWLGLLREQLAKSPAATARHTMPLIANR